MYKATLKDKDKDINTPEFKKKVEEQVIEQLIYGAQYDKDGLFVKHHDTSNLFGRDIT